MEMILDDSGSGAELILRFRGTEREPIDGAWGGVFAVLPDELNPDGEGAQVDYLDASLEPVQGYAIPGLKDLLTEILKQLDPGGVADSAELIFQAIGVGRMGDIDTEGTLFDETSGYTPIAKTWEDIYWEGE